MESIEAEDDIEQMLWTAEKCMKQASEECLKAAETYKLYSQKKEVYMKLIEALKTVYKFNNEHISERGKRKRQHEDEYIPTQQC